MLKEPQIVYAGNNNLILNTDLYIVKDWQPAWAVGYSNAKLYVKENCWAIVRYDSTSISGTGSNTYGRTETHESYWQPLTKGVAYPLDWNTSYILYPVIH